MPERYAIILCGGSGTRLWPLSRSRRPKHLLSLNGQESLLQQTARRLTRRVSPRNVLTVTHEDQKFEVKGQLGEVSPDLPPSVLCEPAACNTLPAIARAVARIHEDDPEGLIGVFPSDHAINDEDAFLSVWEAAEEGARQGYLTLLGIAPTEPATGYGYIQAGDRLIGQSGEIRRVERFVEKPDRANAERFVAAGYLWNGGIFVFRARDFMSLLQRLQPDMHALIDSIDEHNVEDVYARLPKLSIDYGLAEKADNVAVVPANFGWSDLGNWESIYQTLAKDDAGNTARGDVVMMDTHNSMVWSSRGVLATVGMRDVAVIQTDDATLVCDRSRAEDIKHLVLDLTRNFPAVTECHLTVHRPWGTYTVLEEGPNFKIKRIVVNPGGKLSMQMHRHRSEHWVVLSGVAGITNGERRILLRENESTYIPIATRHRLENNQATPLQIIEVQCGDYVGEDDIIRFEDTYGRVG
ncbi:Alginate biosynthesis protein AlgA [compost metagenome]